MQTGLQYIQESFLRIILIKKGTPNNGTPNNIYGNFWEFFERFFVFSAFNDLCYSSKGDRRLAPLALI